MKLVIRNWPWLAALLTVGLIFATYLIAQVQFLPTGNAAPQIETSSVKLTAPNAKEATDSKQLIDAVNAGDAETTLGILQAYNSAEGIALNSASHLGKASPRAELKELFLKATVALSLSGRITNVQARLQAATSLGYERPVWIARWLDTNWVERCDGELARSPLAPIAVLNINLDDPNFTRFFQWYDRYAEQLHSVVINGDDLTNAKIKDNYNQANRTLNAIFQLIKSRKPDAFVWLSVVKQDDRTDEKWLRAMTFRPDGLQISNLRQFHSPFAETRRRYVAIFGEDMPMMVSGFYGYKDALQTKGKVLSSAKKIQAAQTRTASKADAMSELGGIGAVVGEDLERHEVFLKSLGYRGLSTHLLLVEALANKHKAKGGAAVLAKSELVDPRVGLLDTYYSAQDYRSMTNLISAMLAESAPGDMNWTVAKLYNGIVLLSQNPPAIKKGVAALDEVLAFDFSGRPGRDHYILGAAKWRIHAASLTGDKAKAEQLVQQIESREFRFDLKTKFLKETRGEQNTPATQTK